MGDFAHELAEAVVRMLPRAGGQRLAALHAVRSVRPDADVTDTIILARWLLTGREIEPEDPYPYRTGDVVALGPGIFASTQSPTEGTVINWQGENFVPQRDSTPPPEDTDLPTLDAEPVPEQGEHWTGRLG